MFTCLFYLIDPLTADNEQTSSNTEYVTFVIDIMLIHTRWLITSSRCDPINQFDTATVSQTVST